MARTEPFDKYLDEYEKWFIDNKYIYESELKAVEHFIPKDKKGIEIGIGTGRFAIPFGISEGVEPSTSMRNFASLKGLKVYDGTAENLPFADESYDFALMVTTICFVDDVRKSFLEVKRILKPGGTFIISLVDKLSALGKIYEKMKEQNKFYRFATFYSTDEVTKLLKENEFKCIEVIQTVFGDLSEIHEVQKFKEGYGEGGFVTIKSNNNWKNTIT
jgi:ubiquinone/menaquinone biosynthesis C-methylase UbiE